MHILTVFRGGERPKGRFPSLQQLQGPQTPRLGFIIHGGAGVITKGSLTPEKEKEFRDKLSEAVVAGYKALQAGKSSLDAVEIAIRILEDSPLFNAGKGAVFTNDGKNELDASIMNGKTLGCWSGRGTASCQESDHVGACRDGKERARDDDRRRSREVRDGTKDRAGRSEILLDTASLGRLQKILKEEAGQEES